MTTDQISTSAQARQAIAQADPTLLLASLVCITGRTDRIAEFASHIKSAEDRFVDKGWMDEAKRRDLNAWAVEVVAGLETDQATPAQLGIDDDSFLTLASKLTKIPLEHGAIPLLRDQGGFDNFVRTVPATTSAPTGFKLLIIGAGMAGITMAITAKRAGLDFQVLERNPGVGGVWWQNRYPGVGVDTHSKYYSLSFQINRGWTNSHPEGDEFREYLADVAQTHEVADGITFGAEVTDLVWNSERLVWSVSYQRHGKVHEVEASVVVTAAGYLTTPQVPDVPGLETFEGRWFHSAEWDTAYDFADKRVAVVGAGCTSVQVVDRLAPIARSMTVFQRQPHWVGPPGDDGVVPEPERWMLLNVPTYAEWARVQKFLMVSDVNHPIIQYDAEWAATHDRSINEANHGAMEIMLDHLRSSFVDRPDLIERLTPDFAFMGKRPVRDPGGYYAALKKSTTTLVTTGISKAVPSGLVDLEGNLHEVDVIAFATGFRLDFLRSWNIQGRDGASLADVWKDRPVAYLGCQVPGFPNLFVTSGPNGNSNHAAAHNFLAETVAHYVIECVQTMFELKADTIEPTPEAQERWITEMDDKLKQTVWTRELRATNYYRNDNGDVVLPYPIRIDDYWSRLREPALEDMHFG